MKKHGSEKEDKAGRMRSRIVLVILFLEIIWLMYATWKWGVQHLDSDDSAEMILARLLSTEGGILSRNWYYSTELRVVNTQLVMSFLFRFISGWHLVRTLGTGILLALLALSYLFFCSRSRQKETLLLLAPAILWPFSAVYQDFVLYGLYYIPHLCMIFLILGLVLSGENGPRTKRIADAVLLCAVAFAAGLGGFRLAAVCCLPLFLAALTASACERHFKERGRSPFLLPSLASLLASAAGWIVNRNVLSKIYSFAGWERTRLCLPRTDMLKTVFLDTLRVFGIAKGKGITARVAFVFAAVFLLMTVCMAVRLLWRLSRLSAGSRLLFLYFILSYLATAGAGIFTTMSGWKPRYLIMACIGCFVIPALYAEAFPAENRGRKWRRAAFIVLAAAILIPGLRQYRQFAKTDKLADKREAFEVILNSGIRFGFGDWDASDVLTEISDGRIRICKLYRYRGPEVWYWLMEKDFRRYAEGQPVFILLDKRRLDFNGNIGHLAGMWTVDDLDYLAAGVNIFENERYVVYKYDTLEALENASGARF